MVKKYENFHLWGFESKFSFHGEVFLPLSLPLANYAYLRKVVGKSIISYGKTFTPSLKPLLGTNLGCAAGAMRKFVKQEFKGFVQKIFLFKLFRFYL